MSSTQPIPPARSRLAAARVRLDGSWVHALALRLKAIDVVNAIVLFGSAMLLSALPLVIALSSAANQRVDDDVSRHIGLDSHGARIVRTLFRANPSHDTGAIALAVVIGVAGTLAAVSFLQEIYERVFALERRGWRDVPRFAAWVVVLLALLALEGVAGAGLHDAVGPVVQGLVSFAGLSVFFAWTIHFLLAGRVSWRAVVRPALLTGLLWIGMAIFSSYVFSSTLVSDSRLYGTIGVMFTLLTWFLAIGAVIVLGAAGGVVWEERSRRATA